MVVTVPTSHMARPGRNPIAGWGWMQPPEAASYSAGGVRPAGFDGRSLRDLLNRRAGSWAGLMGA